MRTLPLTLIAALQIASAAAQPKIYLTSDFEAPSALNQWRVSPAPATPTETVGLALGPGRNGQGAVLTYRITCDRSDSCANPASAVRDLPNKASRKKGLEISFWARFDWNVEVFLTAKDTSGQALRFPVTQSIEYPAAGQWQHAVVSLSAKRAEDARAELSQKSIVQIGFSIRPRATLTVQGDFNFDDVEVRDSDPIFQLAPQAPVVPLPPHFSKLAPLGVNIHLLRDYGSLNLAQKAGFQFVRMDMLWTNVERGGRYRFFAYDALLRALEARGMGVLWILDYGHPEHGGKVPRTTENIEAFGRFAEAAAAHFKGRNARYEIWNEPDTAYFWPPAPNATEYSALLREAIAAIHRADPSAKVASGGVSKIDLPFLSQAIDPTFADGLSAISVHPYTEPGPEKVAPGLEALRAWVDHTLQSGTEVWDTEWGYPSTTRDRTAEDGHGDIGRRRQAVLVTREMLTLWALGFPLGLWYDLRDDGTDPHNPDHNYGLLDAAGNEKPSMAAVRMLMNAVHGRNYIGMLQKTPPDVHAMRLDGSSDTLFIVWSDNPMARHIVELPKAAFISAASLTGENLATKARSAERVQLPVEEAAGPVYIFLKR